MASTIRSSEGRFGDALGVEMEMGVATTTGLGIGMGIGLVMTRGLGIGVGTTGETTGGATTGVIDIGSSTTGSTGGAPTTTGAGVAGAAGFCNKVNSAGEMVGEAAGGTTGGAVVIIWIMP